MLRVLVPILWIATAGLFGPAAGRLACGPQEWTPAPSGNLPFYYDLYTFRGQGGGTTIVAAYAVEAGELRSEREDGCVQYRMVVSLVLADTATGSVSRTDDSVTVRFEGRPDEQHLLRTHLEVQAPPSATTVQRVIVSDVTTPGYGQLYRGDFPIPSYDGPELMLSDIAVGEIGLEGGWQRGEVTLALLPTGRLPEGAFTLYYEIYNLPDGNDYTTELSIERLLDRDDAIVPDPDVSAVRTRFSGTSISGDDAVSPELRELESALPEGRYRLVVRVHDDVSGASAERTRLFRIGD